MIIVSSENILKAINVSISKQTFRLIIFIAIAPQANYVRKRIDVVPILLPLFSDFTILLSRALNM